MIASDKPNALKIVFWENCRNSLRIFCAACVLPFIILLAAILIVLASPILFIAFLIFAVPRLSHMYLYVEKGLCYSSCKIDEKFMNEIYNNRREIDLLELHNKSKKNLINELSSVEIEESLPKTAGCIDDNVTSHVEMISDKMNKLEKIADDQGAKESIKSLKFEYYDVPVTKSESYRIPYLMSKNFDPKKKTLYFIHGNVGNIFLTAKYISVMQRNFGCNVISLELPGFGTSCTVKKKKGEKIYDYGPPKTDIKKSIQIFIDAVNGIETRHQISKEDVTIYSYSLGTCYGAKLSAACKDSKRYNCTFMSSAPRDLACIGLLGFVKKLGIKCNAILQNFLDKLKAFLNTILRFLFGMWYSIAISKEELKQVKENILLWNGVKDTTTPVEISENMFKEITRSKAAEKSDANCYFVMSAGENSTHYSIDHVFYELNPLYKILMASLSEKKIVNYFISDHFSKIPALEYKSIRQESKTIDTFFDIKNKKHSLRIIVNDDHAIDYIIVSPDHKSEDEFIIMFVDDISNADALKSQAVTTKITKIIKQWNMNMSPHDVIIAQKQYSASINIHKLSQHHHNLKHLKPLTCCDGKNGCTTTAYKIDIFNDDNSTKESGVAVTCDNTSNIIDTFVLDINGNFLIDNKKLTLNNDQENELKKTINILRGNNATTPKTSSSTNKIKNKRK